MPSPGLERGCVVRVLGDSFVPGESKCFFTGTVTGRVNVVDARRRTARDPVPVDASEVYVA